MHIVELKYLLRNYTMRGLFCFISLAAFIIAASLISPTAPSAESNISYTLELEQSFENYKVRIFRNADEGMGYFEILRNGKRVHLQKGYKFGVGHLYSDSEYKEMGMPIRSDMIKMGSDITGKGAPNLVINEWTGGAHCCIKYHIFEIGKHFKNIAVLDAGDGDLAHFQMFGGHKQPVFVAADWTFAYWRAGFAQSPAPEIILSYKNNSYALDFGLMRKQAPSDSAMDTEISQIQKNESWKEGDPPPDLWRYMLDLIYSGNASLAWRFFDKAWLPTVKGKEKFRQDFKAHLQKSPYWKQIQEMNK
jgi:hypothetical protein